MNTELIQIRDSQRNSWDSFSGGWRKWDDFTMRFLQDQGNCIIDELSLMPTDKVLDISSGTGEPGLTIASRLSVGGTVVATDLSEQMLQIADIKAKALSLDNFSTQVADACDLPFEDESFDKISCRLGFMFYPDTQLAAREMFRVLKPGGYLVATVWAEPGKNPWITTMMGALKRHLDLPAPDPNGPGMFRCSAPGFLTALFASIGASGGTEKGIEGIMTCRSADEYWEFMNDVIPPVVSALKDATAYTRQEVMRSIFGSFEHNSSIQTAYGARLFKIRKPD